VDADHHGQRDGQGSNLELVVDVETSPWPLLRLKPGVIADRAASRGSGARESAGQRICRQVACWRLLPSSRLDARKCAGVSSWPGEGILYRWCGGDASEL
jgi:hypothetical protein